MATVRLPRLPVNWKDQPQLFERYWDEAMTSVENALNGILQIPGLQAAIDAANTAAENANDSADAAQVAADNAQTAADGAQGSADQNAVQDSIVNSYVSGFTPPLISITNAGVVTIANHTRVYGDPSINPSVSVTGGTFPTSATSGQVVRVYYDQASRAGGAVTYLFTVDPAAPPAQGGNRHSVGVVAVPAPAAPPASGRGVQPPGYVYAI